MSSKPQIIHVTNFDADHPTYEAEVVVHPNGRANINSRIDWTHNREIDQLAMDAAKRLAKAQRAHKAENRVRCKIRRIKDTNGKEVMDRSPTHATITVWPKSNRYTGQTVNITFRLDASQGEYLVPEVIYEAQQWIEIGTAASETRLYSHDHHEWKAARVMAIKAIEKAIRDEAACKAMLRGYEKKARDQAAKKRADKIRRQGGEQLPLL